MRTCWIIAAGLAAVLALIPAPAPAQTAAAQAAQMIAAGPHVLTDFELYHLVNGRNLSGTTDQGTTVTISFKADGTASTGYDSGTWSVKNGKVNLSWISADKAWGLRTDGAGRFYSTRSNREVMIH